MRGKKIAPAEFRIVPTEKGKAVRIVRFHLGEDDIGVECFDEKTLEECPASAHDRICSHVHKAIGMLLGSQPKEGQLMRIVVLWNRHGDGSLTAVTNDAGLAARWAAIDPNYRHIVPMEIDDRRLEARISGEEESRREQLREHRNRKNIKS